MLSKLLVYLVVVSVLWNTRKQLAFWFKLTWHLLKRDFSRTGKLLFEEGSRNSRSRAAKYLVKATNNGDVSAMLPLGKLFEESDEPHKAIMVYSVLEHRTRDVSPFLNVAANDRLDLLQANRLETTVARPAFDIRVHNQTLRVNPPATHTDVKPVFDTAVKEDAHNVHDSGLVRSIRASYNNLKESHPPTLSLSESLLRIREACTKQNNLKALKALDTIEKSSVGVSCLNGEQEVDVLHTVYNRICSHHDPSVVDSLVERLADCIGTDGSVVCTMGRVARVVDTLSVVDNLVTVKPTWALRRELLDLASQVRQDNPDAEGDDFKRLFTQKAKHTYVDTHLISEPVLDAEISSWVDNI